MAKENGRPQRIAIVGGGAGAMAAAFALTEEPGWRDHREVTVYQMGWRLGGKGASGRDHSRGDRIQEHGIHIFMGCYENAFALMRRVYDQCTGRNLAPGSPFRSWSDAFKPHHLATYMEHLDGAWKPWTVPFPARDGEPGDGRPVRGLWGCVVELIDWLHGHFERTVPRGVRTEAVAYATRWPILAWVRVTIVEVLGFFEEGLGPAGSEEDHVVLLGRARSMAVNLHEDSREHRATHHHAIAWLIDTFRNAFHAVVADRLALDDDLRRLWILLDLAAGVVVGILRDGVLSEGFDALDRYEFREWLGRHGVSEETRLSAPVTGLYDLAFAFEDGSPKTPNFAAGAALRVAFRFVLMYKGAFTYKMQAGMGDSVFGPLYLVLKDRGVRFEFFHKATALHPSADGRHVDSVDFQVQANVKDKQKGYGPLYTVKGLPCWPDRPRYDQLVEGDALREGKINLESAWAAWPGAGSRTLRRGDDYDALILATSLGPLPQIASELVAISPEWKGMVEGVRSVPTQAFQFWINRDAAGLGWHSSEPALVGTFVEPMDSWADMSQVIAAETWPPEAGVQNIAYFCGAMPDVTPPPPSDHQFPSSQIAVVKAQALDFLENHVRSLWPGAETREHPETIDWNILVDLSGAKDEARLDAQYLRANIDPSERYVQSVAGSTRFRLAPDASGFQDLYLAGDWTRGGWNSGCFENAVISGLIASRALCGQPAHIPGETDFEPEAQAEAVETTHVEEARP